MTHASSPTLSEALIRSAVPTFLVADVADTARFPSFTDYELEYYEDKGTVYCYASSKTDMARAVQLQHGFGQTKESAAKVVERSFIAARDGYDAAEEFYAWSNHR